MWCGDSVGNDNGNTQVVESVGDNSGSIIVMVNDDSGSGVDSSNRFGGNGDGDNSWWF